MKYLIFILILLAGSCYNAKPPGDNSIRNPVSDVCLDSKIIETMEKAPCTVQRIGEWWTLVPAAGNKRLLPCDQNLGAAFQVDGLKVLVSGDYPEWHPSPNVRYVGQPFLVRRLERAE